MEDKLNNPQAITPNFIFFSFKDFAFHNYGQMFPEDWYKKSEDTLALDCSPDTDTAIQDALEGIVKELHHINKIDYEEKKRINLFDKGDKFDTFTKWLNDNANKFSEFSTYIEKNIKNFAAKKHKESEDLCNSVFKSLYSGEKGFNGFFLEFKKSIEPNINKFFNKEKENIGEEEKEKFLYKYLLVLLRTIPQPWNALGAGEILRNLISKDDEENKNIEHWDTTKYQLKYPPIKIKNILGCSINDAPKEYKDVVLHLQFYLEYALIFDTPADWAPPPPPPANEASYTDAKATPPPMPIIMFPLIDNGFFRGCFYFISKNSEKVDSLWEDEKNLEELGDRCRHFVNTIRTAHETELMDVLLKEDDEEKDIYKRILKNIHYIQEVSLGSLWKIDDNGGITQKYVTGYGRKFKEKGYETPGIYWYKNYENYKAFLFKKSGQRNGDDNLTKDEEGESVKITELYKNNKEDFYLQYPKVKPLTDDLRKEISAKPCSYYYQYQKGLDIKWRLILPVVQENKLKAVYFLYYRDPIVILDLQYKLLSALDDEDRKNIESKRIFGARARQIMKFFSAIDAHEYRKHEIMKHGTRAAVAAIMGRNMSHNLGSHVLSYWKNDLIEFKEKLSKLLTNVMPINIDDTGSLTNISEEFLQDKDCLQKSYFLFDYLKNRMDFVAEISTLSPSWEKTMRFNKDIITPFTKDQIAILDNIIESEEFGLSRGNFIISYNNTTDVSVSIPHGAVGVHAFYAILENIIRNSAKHGGKTISDKSKVFKITIEQKDIGDYIAITIKDNVGNCDKKIKDNKRVIDILNDEIDEKEGTHYVNDEGKLVRGNWGIKEIKLCANFLRMRDTDYLTDKFKKRDVEEEKPLISLSCYDSNCKSNSACNKNENEKNLAFTIYLRKPKEVFVVYAEVDNVLKKVLKSSNELAKHGIHLSTIEEMNNVLKRNENIPHRFLVVYSENNIFNNIVKEYRERLPLRVVVNKATVTANNKLNNIVNAQIDFNLSNNAKEENILTFIENIYKQYCVSKFGKNCMSINSKQDEIQVWAIKDNGDIDVTIGADHPIVFDDHGNEYHKLIKSPCISYYHPFGTTIGNSFFMVMKNPPAQKPEKMIVLYELFEMSKVKIVIADERIYKNNFNKVVKIRDDPKPNVIDFLSKYMGISIVEINKRTVEPKFILEDSNKGDFLIIHKGIIEKLGSAGEDLLKKAKDLYAYIIIDSGRGVPDDLSKGVYNGTYYIEIGTIEGCIENLDKYSLVQTLFSLRRPKDAR